MNMALVTGLVVCVISQTGASTDGKVPPTASAPAADAAPRELGDIHWKRSFDDAVGESNRSRKPLLVLFQEVPGCATCVNYGEQVLRHPLVVEAAETLFISTAIYNNIPGDDERVLKLFEEQAWNNPVVRIVSADRTELCPRVAGDYSVGGLATAMLAALEKCKRPTPRYLKLLAEQGAARARGVETAEFAMSCFWEGEAAFGRVDGVVWTRPGHRDGLEVVEVAYDPGIIAFEKLVRLAKQERCATRVYFESESQKKAAETVLGQNAFALNGKMREDKDNKYYLSRTPLRYLPMTETQACRVNAALAKKVDAHQFLSPRQNELLGVIQSAKKATWPEAIGATDLVAAWKAARAIADRQGGGRADRLDP